MSSDKSVCNFICVVVEVSASHNSDADVVNTGSHRRVRTRRGKSDDPAELIAYKASSRIRAADPLPDNIAYVIHTVGKSSLRTKRIKRRDVATRIAHEPVSAPADVV